MTAIEADVVAEGRRLLALAEESGVPLRLLGGVAIRLRAPGEFPPTLARRYADLDFVTARGGASGVQRFFRDEGYEPHVAFNALHGKDRLLFFDNDNERQVDVFVGEFRMSHKIPIGNRLELDPVSVPLAELLLTKLQIAELNEKDVRDTVALLHGHDIGEGDGETLNVARVAELCAAEWGLWRTITRNLVTCREYVGRYELSATERQAITTKLETLLERIEQEPKSRAWRLRARIGERKRWYDLPEEVAGGP
jgi:hypothetical protein